MPSPQNPPAPARGVWITRAEPGAGATAARVSALGCRPIIAPVLAFHAIEDSTLDIKPGEALAFTSINGVASAAPRIAARDMTVFAVGDATAEAARAAGFAHVLSASGDVTALAALIVRHQPPGGVLHPAATVTAGDLVGRLQAAGLAARTVAVYRTNQAKGLYQGVAAALDDQTLAVVLLHSPRAACAVADLLTARAYPLQGITALGLSQACIAPLTGLGFGRLVSAATPREDALMALLAETGDFHDHG